MITNCLKSFFVIAMFVSMVLTACRNTKDIICTPVEELGQDEYSGFDEKQKLRYVISHDDKNIYVLLNTLDPITAMKLIRTELIFYFDLPSEKKKSLYVQYPIKKEQTNGLQGRTNSISRPKQGRQSDLNKIVSRLPNEALFYADGAGVLIDRTDTATGISLEISTADQRELDYALTMPIHLISSQGIDGLEGLKIGIESKSQQDPSQMARSRGAMGGGGRQDGLRDGRGSQNAQHLGSAIDIWLAISLPKKE